MRKYFIAFILLIASVPIYSQIVKSPYTDNRRADSLRIDSLKKTLPSLSGSDRINCMIRLCQDYEHITPIGGFVFKNDSIHQYAMKAYNEATKINYKTGIAMSLMLMETKSNSLKENNFRQALHIGEETNNDNVLGWAYYGLENVTKNTEYTKKAAYYFQKSGDLVTPLSINNIHSSQLSFIRSFCRSR